MKRQLLHTPEGVRDIYNDECEKKLILQDELLKVQKQYGYHPIQTPTFEFFDTFGREIGTTPSKDLYKFLTGREIRWYFDRILHLPLRDVPQCILVRRRCRSVSAIWEIHF